MKGEINRDWYCSIGRDKNEQVNFCHNDCAYYKCGAFHRKWPTPEQFKEEYGDDYPDEGAVYVKDYKCSKWQTSFNIDGIYNSSFTDSKFDYIVCACTPWGKPPDNWRPE